MVAILGTKAGSFCSAYMKKVFHYSDKRYSDRRTTTKENYVDYSLALVGISS